VRGGFGFFRAVQILLRSSPIVARLYMGTMHENFSKLESEQFEF
jgi:hypothetical protein